MTDTPEFYMSDEFGDSLRINICVRMQAHGKNDLINSDD
jgi:hypothetical protein